MNEEKQGRNAQVIPERSSGAVPKAGAATESRGKNISRRLVLASAMAVLPVYTAGYVTTQSAAAQIAAQSIPPVALVQTATAAPSLTTTSATPVATAATTRVPAAISTGTPRAAGTSVPLATATTIPASNATSTPTATSAN